MGPNARYPEELFRSIVFQIYFYYLADSRIFVTKMLPALSHIFNLLQYCKFCHLGEKPFYIAEKHNIALLATIEEKVNLFIS